MAVTEHWSSSVWLLIANLVWLDHAYLRLPQWYPYCDIWFSQLKTAPQKFPLYIDVICFGWTLEERVKEHLSFQVPSEETFVNCLNYEQSAVLATTSVLLTLHQIRLEWCLALPRLTLPVELAATNWAVYFSCQTHLLAPCPLITLLLLQLMRLLYNCHPSMHLRALCLFCLSGSLGSGVVRVSSQHFSTDTFIINKKC